MITGDLDAALVQALRSMAEAGELPATAVRSGGGTWRPVPAGDPAAYATSLPFEIARQAGRPPLELAAALATALGAAPWVHAAEPSGAGYLTITVTAQWLAAVAPRIVAAGADCARSNILVGQTVVARPWPDPAAAPTWRQAWADQAAAMTARLAEAAGASITCASGGERGASGPPLARRADSPVGAAVDYLGAASVRYRLARTPPDRTGGLAQPDRDRLEPVQRAHAEAASTLRWADDLNVSRRELRDGLAAALTSQAERELLGLLSWLPERVGSAARRHRPDELPRYLEDVAAAWTRCRQERPALPFGGPAAPRDPAVTGGRLLLADAVRTVLAAGLTLAGLPARAQI